MSASTGDSSPINRFLLSLSFLVTALYLAGVCPVRAESVRSRVQAKPRAAVATGCDAATRLPAGFTRVYIALNKKDGSGQSPEEARDGSSAEKFDRILRCYSEGCADPAAPHRSISKTENLVVCLGPGTFQTEGTYDYLIDVQHKLSRGFTLGKGWKIHGSGIDKTKVQLATYLPIRAVPNPQNMPVDTGTNIVFGTNSDAASDIEISDLTIDGNYPALKAQAQREGIRALNLDAIDLRSDRGHDWIHDVHVMHAAGEIGAMDGKWETFPIRIYSVKRGSSPEDSRGNIIERVNMSDWGGGACTAIAVANAVAEVRNNRVEGYAIGYGGWQMGPVRFHDNISIGSEYGFNIDSLANRGVVIERNLILNPRKYGIVVGGGGTYAGFIIRNNTIQIDQSGVIALIFQGNVTDAEVQGNKFLWRGKTTIMGYLVGATAIRNYAAGRGALANRGNAYQENRISAGLKITFSGSSRMDANCLFGNRDESGKALKQLPDNSRRPCTLVRGTP